MTTVCIVGDLSAHEDGGVMIERFDKDGVIELC